MQRPPPNITRSDTLFPDATCYRAAAKNNRSAIERNMAIALSRAGLSTKARPANASDMRKLAIGSDLVKTSRKLDRAEAAAFMRQVAVDPAVAHVEVDQIGRAHV